MSMFASDSESYAFSFVKEELSDKFVDFIINEYGEDDVSDKKVMFLIPFGEEHRISSHKGWLFKEMIPVSNKQAESFMRVKEILSLDFIDYMKEINQLN